MAQNFTREEIKLIEAVVFILLCTRAVLWLRGKTLRRVRLVESY